MKYLIEGPDAARLLDKVTPRNIQKLAIGQVYYTGWCDDDGKLLDDGTVTRLGEQSFRLTSAEPSLRWLAMNAVGMQVSIAERTDQMAALSLQGPKSRAVLNRCCGTTVDGLKFFRMAPNVLAGKPVTISRTGYTGDLGYEIWMDAADALPVWDALMAPAAITGSRRAASWRWTWRASKPGLFMLDVDYTAATHAWIAGQKSSPYEMGLGWTVNLDKPGYFVGRRALEREAREGSAWKLVGLESRLGGARASLRCRRPAAADSGHGRARQPAGAARRQAGRLCVDEHVVAGAQEVHRARAPAAAVTTSPARV